MLGEVIAGGELFATVPAGEKWVTRNVSITNVAEVSTSSFTLAIEKAGGGAFPIWTKGLDAGASFQPVLLQTLYTGDKIKASVALLSGASFVSISVVVYAPA